MKYKVIYSETFKVQLKEIITYIISSFSKKVASNYLDYLDKQIKNLEVLPRYGKEIKLLNRRQCRYLVSKKNLVLYEINEEKKEVRLIGIVTSNENYLNLL